MPSLRLVLALPFSQYSKATVGKKKQKKAKSDDATLPAADTPKATKKSKKAKAADAPVHVDNGDQQKDEGEDKAALKEARRAKKAEAKKADAVRAVGDDVDKAARKAAKKDAKRVKKDKV